MIARQNSRLDPVAQMQLLQDRGHIVFDGLFLQIQRAADFLVAASFGHQTQDLFFAFRQLIQRIGRAPPAA